MLELGNKSKMLHKKLSPIINQYGFFILLAAIFLFNADRYLFSTAKLMVLFLQKVF